MKEQSKSGECWTCDHWKQTYIVKHQDKIDVAHGVCPFREGTVDDLDEICKEHYKKIEGKK